MLCNIIISAVGKTNSVVTVNDLKYFLFILLNQTIHALLVIIIIIFANDNTLKSHFRNSWLFDRDCSLFDMLMCSLSLSGLCAATPVRASPPPCAHAQLQTLLSGPETFVSLPLWFVKVTYLLRSGSLCIPHMSPACPSPSPKLVWASARNRFWREMVVIGWWPAHSARSIGQWSTVLPPGEWVGK